MEPRLSRNDQKATQHAYLPKLERKISTGGVILVGFWRQMMVVTNVAEKSGRVVYFSRGITLMPKQSPNF